MVLRSFWNFWRCLDKKSRDLSSWSYIDNFAASFNTWMWRNMIMFSGLKFLKELWVNKNRQDCLGAAKVLCEPLEPRLMLSASPAFATIIDEDFSGDLSSWTVSTGGSPVDYTDAEILSGELKLRANSGSGASYIYARNNTAFDAVTDVVTQSFTVGGSQEGMSNFYPELSFWLTDSGFQNGLRIRLREYGGYTRLMMYTYTDGVETYLGDRQYIADISTEAPNRFVGDNVTVQYDTTDVVSLTYYDASSDTTYIIPRIGSMDFVDGEVDHGLDFATIFADGAYTAVSNQAGAGWTTITGYVDSVTTIAAVIPPEPVITTILGTGIAWHNTYTLSEAEAAATIESVLTDLSDKGFSMSWDASPDQYVMGILENQTNIDYCVDMASEVADHGMANNCALNWRTLLPKYPSGNETAWLGEVLDPETSEFVTPTGSAARWNFGSPEALAAFANRSACLFDALGPYQMYTIDEQIIASLGDNANYQTISTYWTSPTYSIEALGTTTDEGSFRHYLSTHGYSGASTAKFPVTTIAVAPSSSANMGLPAITIDASNSDRLQADNNWGNSTLWQYWYDWRTDVYASWVDTATTAAYNEWGSRSDWQGCVFSVPSYWYDTALGIDIDKIASVPHVDYLVAGYYSGSNFQEVKDVALEHDKKWGGMVELSHYGQVDGVDPETIVDTFKFHVDAGASVMFAYAGANFRTDRTTPTSSGAYYMPDQIAAWAECIDWLEQGRGLKQIQVEPLNPLLAGDANRDSVVSAGDYASVQANFGSVGELGIPGDANGDGVVSAGDYASIQANFGNTLTLTVGVTTMDSTPIEQAMTTESQTTVQNTIVPEASTVVVAETYMPTQESAKLKSIKSLSMPISLPAYVFSAASTRQRKLFSSNTKRQWYASPCSVMQFEEVENNKLFPGFEDFIVENLSTLELLEIV